MRRFAPWLWVVLAISLPFWLQDQFALYSLNLLLGYTGQLSLGHVAFFGIGAYVSALFALGFELDYGADSPLTVGPQPVWIAFVLGIAFAAFFGWLVGRLSFRVRGAYFVIVSISFAVVMRMVALNWVSLTQGPMALNNIPPLSIWIPGHGTIPLYNRMYFYFIVLAVVIVCYLIASRLVHSRVGRALVALRENEALALSTGINVTSYLVLATMVSAGMAGAAGGLYAFYIRIIDPDVFLFIYTVTMVIMVIAGGKGTLAGPIVGGLLFGVLPELLRDVARPEAQWILYGAVMILIVFFLPQGIVPAFMRLFKGASAVGARLSEWVGERTTP
jgi:branched-chain amino acid transport system permease protein